MLKQVDCGGPCPTVGCPTCSDGIQNGGELGVDCGGPMGCRSCKSCLDPMGSPAFAAAVANMTVGGRGLTHGSTRSGECSRLVVVGGRGVVEGDEGLR